VSVDWAEWADGGIPDGDTIAADWVRPAPGSACAGAADSGPARPAVAELAAGLDGMPCRLPLWGACAAAVDPLWVESARVN
jgi:hypothetical protein